MLQSSSAGDEFLEMPFCFFFLLESAPEAASSAGNAIGDTASSAVDAASDGTGLVGDALGDAYATAADQAGLCCKNQWLFWADDV